MRLTVTFEDGTWNFELESTGDEPSHLETFETDDLEEAEEAACNFLRDLRAEEDPLADLFEEEV